ncbi:MAG: membrane protein insertion efficiency factor YidD [Acidobacteria bacterium]|nr:membrane protein insertion efficiency factor YidD [Acidobacteriota bacterium]
MARAEPEVSQPWIHRAINFVPLLIIRFYRWAISPLLPPSCRFYPSCSAYGLRAFQVYPIWRATYLTVWRILRCNPFNPGGFDPLPGCEHEFDNPDESNSPHTN